MKQISAQGASGKRKKKAAGGPGCSRWREGGGLSRTHASGRWLGSLPQGSPKGDMSGSEGGNARWREGGISRRHQDMEGLSENGGDGASLSKIGLDTYANGVCFCLCILSRPRFSRDKSPHCLTMRITGSCRSLWHSNLERATSSGEAMDCGRSAGRLGAAAKAVESGSFNILWTKEKFIFSSPTRKTNRRISIAASYGFSATW